MRTKNSHFFFFTISRKRDVKVHFIFLVNAIPMDFYIRTLSVDLIDP